MGKLRDGVKKVSSCGSAFAAVKECGSVVVWGTSDNASFYPSDQLASGVHDIAGDDVNGSGESMGFVAFKDDGSIFQWGDRYFAVHGGDNDCIHFADVQDE